MYTLYVRQQWRISDLAETLMDIRLHANATTTPKRRAYLQASTQPTVNRAGFPGDSNL
jgi:hypothetical protein